MKYFTLLIMALTSLATPGWFSRLRSRLPRWNVLTNAQKVALVSFISLTLMLPIVTLATLEGTRLASRAVEPVTPPITPPDTSTVSFKNSSFEYDENGDNFPDFWIRTNKSDATDVRTDAFAQDGRYSFKLVGIKGTAKSLSQGITGSWNAGTTLYFFGFAKTVNPNPKGVVRIVVQAKYTDNTLNDFTLLFPSNASYDWIQRNGTITLPRDTKRLTIRIMYQNQTGEGYFDNLYLSNIMPAGTNNASVPRIPAGRATSEF